LSAVALAAPGWRDYSDKSVEWFRSDQAVRVAENILSWQSPAGGWLKNVDTMSTSFTGDGNELNATFDNGATTGELRFLARAFNATKNARYRQAFLRGLDYILGAQYASGGWPQSSPPGRDYTRHITFNDNTMVRLMEFLREVSVSPDYDFVDDKRRSDAVESFDRGIQCILKCQIRVDGQLTVWCAQHDEIDYSPRPGRAYELVSLSGYESAAILRFLMSIEKPIPEVIGAVKAGVRWFDSAKLSGIRLAITDGDMVVVNDPNAPLIWARFYEIETYRPIFADRDGVKKYHLSEISSERRNNYAWYGYWGRNVAEDYERWQAGTIGTRHKSPKE